MFWLHDNNRIIPPDVFPAAVSNIYLGGGFAPAVICDDWLICSGIVGFDLNGNVPSGLRAQTENCFINLECIFTKAQCSLPNIVSVTSYHLGPMAPQLAVLKELKDKYIGEGKHVWTALGVSSLAMEEAKIEIQVIARMNGIIDENYGERAQ